MVTRIRKSRRKAAKPLNPRKKPRQERSQATVEAILTATTRILVKEGYEAASTNRIAREAGVSIGSLYQYYPNKQALVGAVAERHMDERLSLVSEYLKEVATLPLREAIARFVEALVEAQRLNPGLERVLMQQIPLVSGLDRVRAFDEQAIAVLVAFMSMRREEVRPEDLPLAAYVILHAVRSVTLASMIFPDQEKDLRKEDLVREVTDLAVGYLVK